MKVLWGTRRERRATFYIRRMVQGARYDISTRAHSIDPALKHLDRFEADPSRYTPGAGTERPPVYLDATLVAEFLDWSGRPEKDGGKQNTPEWRQKQQRTCCGGWAS